MDMSQEAECDGGRCRGGRCRDGRGLRQALWVLLYTWVGGCGAGGVGLRRGLVLADGQLSAKGHLLL